LRSRRAGFFRGRSQPDLGIDHLGFVWGEHFGDDPKSFDTDDCRAGASEELRMLDHVDAFRSIWEVAEACCVGHLIGSLRHVESDLDLVLNARVWAGPKPRNG